MNKLFYETDKKCQDCCHFGYCQIYWGAECKRQGGKRIPRLKTGVKPVQNRKNMNGKISPYYQESYAQIKTKQVNWQL